MGTRFLIKFSLWVALISWVQMNGYKCCFENERMALLELKSFIKSISTSDVESILTSWIDDDCCSWERLNCNATSGRVVELQLRNIRKTNGEALFDGFPVLNFSLFHPFEELQSLDLSDNYLEGWIENEVDDSFGSLKNLKMLNLGDNLLNDSILPYVATLTSLTNLILNDNYVMEVFKPNQLGLANLINLEMLDLSRNYRASTFSEMVNISEKRIRNTLSTQGICKLKNLIELDLSWNTFYGPIPGCLSNLTNLKVLDLSCNHLSGSLPSGIANLTSLEYLALQGNSFEGLFSLSSLANHSKLDVFILSPKTNMLQVEFSQSIPWFPTFQLKALYLSNCNLNGTIPSFLLHQHDLRIIDLSHNKLVGTFPSWLLANNTKLEALYLTDNSFSGALQLPNSKHDLLRLEISKNNFSGQLPNEIGMILPKLSYMNMSGNFLEGDIPSSICEMKELHTMDFSSNNFSGKLPRHLITCGLSLEHLSLSHNNFHGEIFPKYMNLTRLSQLYLDNNLFSGYIGDGLMKLSWLNVLDISNNMLSGQIPHWFSNASFNVLLMSKNLLEGNIPVQLSTIESLEYLDISENRLSGPLPFSFNLSSVQHLYLQKNALNGTIPSALFRNNQFITVDLRDNKFSGSIPYIESSGLRVLLLRGNELQGHIPNELCHCESLSVLDLSHNRLNGSIPSCFTNMSYWTRKAEYYYANIFTPRGVSYTLDDPSRISYNSTIDLRQLIESYRESGWGLNDGEVEFMIKKRYESYKGDIRNFMFGLDLSSNELTGDIPSEIGELQEILALNFSHNSLSGSIPKSFSGLKNIESLDLSYNKLSGEIPQQLTELNYLSTFIVSFNNLSGSIPNKGQFATFDESSYGGNPGLCGVMVRTSCSVALVPASEGEERDEPAIDMVAFKWSFVASYITLILGLLAVLLINSYWRNLWFSFVDECMYSCFYWLLKYVW